MEIQFSYSLALDLLAFIEKVHIGKGSERYHSVFWNEVNDNIREIDQSILSAGLIMSNLSSVLSLLVNYKVLEKMSANELCEILLNVNERHIEEQYSKEKGWYKTYIDTVTFLNKESSFISLIRAIDAAGFTRYWNESIQSIVGSSCRTASKLVAKYNCDLMMQYLEELKGFPLPKEIIVFISYCSYPLSYYLCNGVFLQNNEEVNDEKYLLRSIVHELFHGFSSTAFVSLHQRIVKEDPYLRTIFENNEWSRGIGPEEMYVKAVEYFVLLKCGIYTDEEILIMQDGLYGNSLPLMVIVYDQLKREKQNIGEINQWFAKQIQENAIEIGRIAEYCDSIIPGYSKNLNKKIECHDKYLTKLKINGLIKVST